MEAVNAEQLKLAARNGAQHFIVRAQNTVRRMEGAYARDVSITEDDMRARRDIIADAIRMVEDPMSSVTAIEAGLAQLVQRVANVDEWLAVKAAAFAKATN